MKMLTAFVLVVVLSIPVAANADPWVMDWTSKGYSVGILTGPYAEGWSIAGTSPATLTPGAIGPHGLPPNFSAPAYTLSFSWEGRGYGGPVSEQSNWQSFEWKAPAPCAGVFTSVCAIRGQDGGGASGSFAFTDPNHFTLDVLVGTGHSHTELVGLGHREGGGVATAAEPAVMLLSGAGLAGAAVLRRSRRA